jgi:hypothetical protein
MTPAVTIQRFPLASTICVADGMVVPLGDVVVAAAAALTTDASTADASVTVAAPLLGDDVEPVEPPPLHAAIVRQEATRVGLKKLIAMFMGSSWCIESSR